MFLHYSIYWASPVMLTNKSREARIRVSPRVSPSLDSSRTAERMGRPWSLLLCYFPWSPVSYLFACACLIPINKSLLILHLCDTLDFTTFRYSLQLHFIWGSCVYNRYYFILWYRLLDIFRIPCLHTTLVGYPGYCQSLPLFSHWLLF